MKFDPTWPRMTYIMDIALTPANTSKFWSNPYPPTDPTEVNLRIFLVKENERKKRPHFDFDFRISLSFRLFGSYGTLASSS